MFTDFEYKKDMQEKAGYSMVGVTALNVVVNTFFMIWKTYDKVKLLVRKAIRWFRLRKLKNKQKKYQ